MRDYEALKHAFVNAGRRYSAEKQLISVWEMTVTWRCTLHFTTSQYGSATPVSYEHFHTTAQELAVFLKINHIITYVLLMSTFWRLKINKMCSCGIWICVSWEQSDIFSHALPWGMTLTTWQIARTCMLRNKMKNIT